MEMFSHATVSPKTSGDPDNGFGIHVYPEAGQQFYGFFKKGTANGVGMYRVNGGEYFSKYHGSRENLLTICKGAQQTILYPVNQQGKVHGTVVVFDTVSLNTLKIVQSSAGMPVSSSEPVYKGISRGCMAGDCKNGYGEYRYAKEFHGIYLRGKTIRGLMIYDNGFYLGSFDGFGNRSGIGYMETGSGYYFGEFLHDRYHGTGFQMENNLLSRAGFYENGIFKKVINK